MTGREPVPYKRRMRALLLVGAGGFLGAVARYAMTNWVQQRLGLAFPWGTFLVNATGCLGFGALIALLETRADLGPELRWLVGVGLLGSFTTFSTFSLETLDLARLGDTRAAVLNVLANVFVGLACVWVGRSLVRAALS